MDESKQRLHKVKNSDLTWKRREFETGFLVSDALTEIW